MFSRRDKEYIISYKLMSHNQNFEALDIDLYTNIYVDRNDRIVEDFKIHRYLIYFGRIFFELLLK